MMRTGKKRKIIKREDIEGGEEEAKERKTCF